MRLALASDDCLANMKQSNGLLQYPNSAYPTDCNANAVTDLDNLCSVFRFLLSTLLLIKEER